MAPRHIQTFKSRISIAAFLSSGRGLVAGFKQANSPLLRDSSGSCRLPERILSELKTDSSYWLSVAFHNEKQGDLIYCQPVTPSHEVMRLQDHYDRYKTRWEIHQQIRAFFLSNGFLEVDTPLRTICPGMEPYLDSFETDGKYLRTSPELHMKRLLAGGYDKIFQMGPCFRAGDVGSVHREEFHMLEWYRAFADLDHLIDDVHHLLTHLAGYSTNPGYFRELPEIVTCESLFHQFLDLKLKSEETHHLKSALKERNIPHDDEDDWDTLYFLLFLNFIEPHLGKERPTIVINYPASQAALAKKAPPSQGGLDYCYRFEVYVQGMELANAFYELTDPETQEERFQKDRQERKNLGKTAYPIDREFIAALESGIPPSAGIALGVDRLVAALLGKPLLADILPFG